MAIGCGYKGGSNFSKHAILFLVILLFSTKACSDDHPHASKRITCMESERKALLAIKSDLYNSDHWLSSWIGYDCCKWRGVACDNTTNHVIRLDLHYPLDQYASFPSKSKVNPSLFELKHLKYLDLSFNNFSTHVPSMIASLIHVEHLNLSNAMFNGLIPQQLGNLSNLRFLNLECCYLYHSLWSNVLSWLSQLTSLEYLDMSCVNLSLANSWIHQINYNSLEHLALSNCLLHDAIGAGTTMIELNSSSNQIRGKFFMNATRKLKHLDLADNSLTKIPLIMRSLIYLEHLDLSYNQITGMIPSRLGNLTSLLFLDVSFNNLSEHIPDGLGNLIRLEYLNLTCNQITGEIPLSMGNLTSLLFLDVSFNKLSEHIPDVLGNLIRLEYLSLNANQITGEIPLSMGNLTSLLLLDVSFNKLSGHIPDGLSNLVYLEELLLFYNNISGQIPENIGRLHNLWHFDASVNNLMGQIPLSLGDLCNLETLDISQNNIGGELTNIFDGLSKCPQGSKLHTFTIHGNMLSGSIPFSLQQLAQLQYLDVSANLLQGNLTEAHFSKLTNLTSLYTSYNSLNLILSDDWLPPFYAKVIDMSYCHLGTKFPSWIQMQTTLSALYLSGVGLYGEIPGWFSDFILKNSLATLDISSNNLNGQLPSSISIFMDLSNNSFEGTIPLSYANFEDVRVLKFSNNHIHGNFPTFFCNLTMLEVLHLSNNYLSGEVPNCHGSYPISLYSLHMNNNSLSGPFPLALRNCNGLVALDLGGNNFSSEIPKWVGRSFPMLRFLRLSSNSFYGDIPISIGNITFLQLLDLSSNNLIGSIPSTIGNFSYMGVKNPLTYECYAHSLSSYNNFYNQYGDNDVECFFHDNIIITAKGSTNEYTESLDEVGSIDLSNNALSGEIPKEITKLHGLYFLNLSNNQLMGRIPENICWKYEWKQGK